MLNSCLGLAGLTTRLCSVCGHSASETEAILQGDILSPIWGCEEKFLETPFPYLPLQIR